MERQTKLADLKLVSKHFPISNYSYPGGNRSQYQHERRQQLASNNGSDRASKPISHRTSSRESNSSVPSMVEDNGSDDDAAAEDDHQYHVTGAQIWDSFWICQEKKEGANDQKGPTLGKPLVNVRPPNAHTQGANEDTVVRSPTQSEIAATENPEWPLPAIRPYQRPRTPRSPPKASYSLFPTPAHHKPSVLAPLRTSRPGTPNAQNGNSHPLQSIPASTVDLPSRVRQKKPTPLNLSPASTMQLPLVAQGPTPPSSAPASPLLCMPSPVLEQQQDSDLAYAKPLSRRPSLANLRKIPGPKTTKAAPVYSYLAMAQAHKSETHLPSTLYRQQSYDVPPISPAPHSAPLPQSSTTSQRPHTKAEVGFSPEIATEIPPMPPIPSDLASRAPSPPRISFWLDSDSDSDEEPSDEESRSLARRILGGLSSSSRDGKGHKRSVSDGRSTGKAAPVRRPRADTTVEAEVERPVELVADEEPKGVEKEKEKEREIQERPRPRRQGSDVFGRILGRRSR